MGKGKNNTKVSHIKTGIVFCLLFGMYLTAPPAARSDTEDQVRTRQMLESILRSAPGGIGLVEDRVFTRLNDYILRLTGYSHEELIGQSARMVYPSDEEYAFVGREKYRQIAEQGTGTVETRWRHKNGDILHVILSSTPLDPSDLSAGVVFTVTDITEKKHAAQALQNRTRWFLTGMAGCLVLLIVLVFFLIGSLNRRKKAEAAIKESEARFQLLYEKAPIGYQSLDEAGHFISVNPAWLETMGYSSEEVIGKSFADFLHPDWQAHFRENFPRFKAVGEVLGVEFEMVKKDGSLILVNFNGKIGRKPNGDFLQTHCVLHDITEQRRAEEKLKMAHEKFLTVLDSIDATIYVADINTHEVLFMNKNMIESFGRDMTGEICFKAFRNGSAPCAFCTSSQLLDSKGKPAGVRVWQDQNPVTGKFYSNHDRAIEWMDGRMVRMQIATDITAYREMEEKLRQAQKMEAIGVLAGGIAHDFNNILFPIVGHTEMLMEDIPGDSPFQSSLKEIYTSALRARDLVRQILAFSRQEKKEPKLMKIQPVITEAMKMIRAVIPSTINMVCDIDHPCGPIVADPVQIHQVVMNLATNAYHAMEETGGELAVCLREIELGETDRVNPDMTPGWFACLTFEDTGTGIHKDVLGKIFDPFFTTKVRGKGTGMGLSVVHGIVTGMSGAIHIDSEPGKGTRVRVYIPLEK